MRLEKYIVLLLFFSSVSHFHHRWTYCTVPILPYTLENGHDVQVSLLTVSDSWWVNTKPALQRWDSQTLPPDRIGKIYLLTFKKIVLLVSPFMCTNLSFGFMLPYSNDAIIHAYQLFNHPLNCSSWQCETERFIFPWSWSVTKINFALHDSNTFFLSPKCHQCPVSCLFSFQLYTVKLLLRYDTIF